MMMISIVMLTSSAFTIVGLIGRWLRDQIFASVSLYVISITCLLSPTAFIERFGIALLVTTRVVRCRVEKLVEVQILEDFSSFLLVLLCFFVFRFLRSPTCRRFLVWTDAITHVLVSCNVGEL